MIFSDLSGIMGSVRPRDIFVNNFGSFVPKVNFSHSSPSKIIPKDYYFIIARISNTPDKLNSTQNVFVFLFKEPHCQSAFCFSYLLSRWYVIAQAQKCTNFWLSNYYLFIKHLTLNYFLHNELVLIVCHSNLNKVSWHILNKLQHHIFHMGILSSFSVSDHKLNSFCDLKKNTLECQTHFFLQVLEFVSWKTSSVEKYFWPPSTSDALEDMRVLSQDSC